MKKNLTISLLLLAFGAILQQTYTNTQTNNLYAQRITLQQAQTAAAKGTFDVILPLIFQNIITTSNVNTPDKNNATLLYWAVYYNNADIVNMLLNIGAGTTILNKQYTNQTSPLTAAFRNQNSTIIQALIGSLLLQSRSSFMNLIDLESTTADTALIESITTSSSDIQTIFSNLSTLFACDLTASQVDQNQTTLEINPENSPTPTTYICTLIDDVIQTLQMPVDTITTSTNLGITQLKIYVGNGAGAYYAEAYDASNQYQGATNFGEKNNENLLRFYNSNSQYLFTLCLSNLTTALTNITQKTPAPFITVQVPQLLTTLTTKDELPITLLGTTQPFSKAMIYSTNGSLLINTYLGATYTLIKNFDPINLSIATSNGALQSVANFVKNNTFTETFYITPATPLFDLKTQTGKPITLINSVTPFDEIKYFTVNGIGTLLTYLGGIQKTINNFSEDAVLVVDTKNNSQTLSSFIAGNNFAGTFYISTLLPLFDIKTKTGSPITLLGSVTPFDEIKYFSIQGTTTLSTYLNGQIVSVDNLNKANIMIFNSKDGTSQTLQAFISGNSFTGTFYMDATPPLFDLKTQTGSPLTIIGSITPFDEIKGISTNGTVTITTYLNKSANLVDNFNSNNITVIGTNNSSQTLTTFMQNGNYQGTFSIIATPPLFDLKTQDGKPITIVGSAGSFNEIKGLNSNGTVTLFPYENGNPVSIENLDPTTITVIDTTNNSQSLANFIQSNSYTGTYFITATPSIFDLKTKNKAQIFILGSKTSFDEIKCLNKNGTPTLFTYIDGAPITVDNFDPNNVMVTDGTNSPTLATFLQGNSYKGNFYITAAPPIFDIKSQNGAQLKIVGSTTPFDEIKYYSLNGTLTPCAYLNGKLTTVDNFDPNNITVVDSNNNAQTLTNFIQNNKFQGSYYIIATPPLFDIKSQNNAQLKITGSTSAFDEVKYFILNGIPILSPYINGALTSVDKFNPNAIYVTGLGSDVPQVLNDFIKGKAYKGNFYITTTKK